MTKPNTDQKTPYIAANINRFSGFAKEYDYYRPSVPKVIVDILTQLAGSAKPRKVIDIGCGTGLSTRIWAKYADEVVGIEPNDEMRRQAKSHSDSSNVHYQKGFSVSTGLPDSCADIVTVVEAFHWMEPTATIKEIARVLRHGGLFATIDYDWPPTINLEAEALDVVFENRAKKLLEEIGGDKVAHKWTKEEHLLQIQKSGLFKYTKEIAVHGIEKGNARRMIGLVLNQSNIQILLKKGIAEEKIGLPAFCQEMKRLLGEKPQSMYFTFRIRLGIKPF
jgi:ubiquinone/menaquinone biosynthesis C-methylase UbiE